MERRLEHYLGASLITAATTMMALPSIAVPCGFDQWGRPVGLQIVGRHRGEAALLQAAALFEGRWDWPNAYRLTRVRDSAALGLRSVLGRWAFGRITFARGLEETVGCFPSGRC